MRYPEGIREVALTEVIRCSRRIVAGAMAFQLGGGRISPSSRVLVCIKS